MYVDEFFAMIRLSVSLTNLSVNLTLPEEKQTTEAIKFLIKDAFLASDDIKQALAITGTQPKQLACCIEN